MQFSFSGPGGANFATFLRKSNVNGALSTTCHIKQRCEFGKLY